MRDLWTIFDQQINSKSGTATAPRTYHQWVGIYPPLARAGAGGSGEGSVAAAAKRYERFFVGGLGWRNQLALHWTDFVVEHLPR